MDLGLQGAVAVVTGGSSGIGLETARLLLAEGTRVAICGRDAGRLERAAANLRATVPKGDLLAQTCDVLDADAVAAFADAVDRWAGGCDILVNNAGQGRMSTFKTTSAADWRAELELKFFSQINTIQSFKPMLDRSSQAAIVGVNSLLALQPEAGMVCTSSARAGVQTLLKSLVGGIRAGDPRQHDPARRRRFGSVATSFRSACRQRACRARTWYAGEARSRHIPLGRFGQPTEPAHAIVFLASPAASFITGARLEVSGGTSRFV